MTGGGRWLPRWGRRALAPRAAPGPAPAPDIAAGAGAYWDQQATGAPSVYWADHTLVRESVNRWVTGEPGLWPIDALRGRWLPRSFGLGLSIGCGTGSLERCLRKVGSCERLDAFDLSAASIRKARRLAAQEGIDGIEYRVENCDELRLAPRRYDIVFFDHSLHHIADPDRLLDETLSALKDGGYLYLDEYVGPSRDEWTVETLRWAREAYEAVDPRLRSLPLAPPIAPDDPSEMIRSSRILPALRERFEIVLDRPYWGNLLFPLFCALDGAALRGEDRRDLVASLVGRERELVESGALRDPLFAVVLARSRA